MEILFDETKHAYTVDGVSVPSVTQLVAPLGDDFDEMDEMMELAVEAAADRGVTMHAYLAHRLSGGRAEDFELQNSYSVFADAVELFLSEHTIEPLLVEAPLGCAEFAGTPDLICEFDGQIAILDYKFVSQIAKSKVCAQLGGYLNLCAENGIFPANLYAVQFLANGEYRLYPADLGAAMASFNACKFIYEIKTKKHPRGCIG